MKKKKNVTTDELSNNLGRIHVPAQKLHNIQTRKMKGLKKTIAERKAEKRANTEESPAAKKQKTVDSM